MTTYLILTLVAVVAVGVATYYLARISNVAKMAISGLYFVIILALAYFLYESIARPIRFEEAKQKRYDATIERLIQIRNAQMAYKSQFGKYAANFDTLITFVKNDSLKVIREIGMVPDSLTMKLSMKEAEKLALKLGIISRDTIMVSVLDSLFGKDFQIDSIRFVPFQNKPFEMAAGIVETASKVKVPVFEAKAHNDIILFGLERQLIVNLNDERTKNEFYPGLKIGSLTEVTNNTGNWE